MSYRTFGYAVMAACLIFIPATLSKISAAPSSENLDPDIENALQGGIYTNEEQVYFANENAETPPPWLSYRVLANGTNRYQFLPIDAYGNDIKNQPTIIIKRDGKKYTASGPICSGDGKGAKQCSAVKTITDIDSTGINLELANGMNTRLNLAREVECWAALPKDKPKADGSVDWHFDAKLSLHDQGGRAIAGGGDTGAPATILRVRKVYWPAPSKNKPSLVLYIHKPEKPDTAESYSWADIDAKRIGINLRWMQASCAIIGTE